MLDLDAANIRVAEYRAHIPDMALLQAQLHRAVLLARERAARSDNDERVSSAKDGDGDE